MSQRRILLISYLFPPAGGVGVQRVISFAKYLPAHGCEVFVLTARNAAAPVFDTSLLKQVPESLKVFRAFTPEPSYQLRDRLWRKFSGSRPPGPATDAPPAPPKASWKSAVRGAIQRILCPDPQIGWSYFALPKARRIIRKYGIDTVIISAPPFSSFRIGLELKKTFPNLVLISDFRDEWLSHFLGMDSGFSDYKRQVSEKLERDIVAASDYVVTVTPPWVRLMQERYPDQPPSKFVYVPNGYDPETFSQFQARPHGQNGRMVITYLGSVYNNTVYSPGQILEAADALPDEVRDALELRFIGRISGDAAPLFENRRFRMSLLGFKPQAEAFRYLEETDYLLLVIGTPGPHSGKLFEYMATGKPLLALSPPEGEVARIIRETRCGRCADIHDAAAVRALLLEAYEAWRSRGCSIVEPDWDSIREYTRPNLVARFVKSTGIAPA